MPTPWPQHNNGQKQRRSNDCNLYKRASMISKLKGIFDSSGPNWACIDVNGVFYHVFCSAKTLDDLCHGTPDMPAQSVGYGSEVKIITEMVVREDLMALYGFSTEAEHEWFQILTSVQGVGMKVALAILSVADPAQMHAAILSGDKTTFSAADGVGPKLATRLVNELKDKVTKRFGDHTISQSAQAEGGANLRVVAGQNAPESGLYEDAASALVHLGYKPFEVNQALAKLKQSGAGGTVEDLVPLALQTLSRAAK